MNNELEITDPFLDVPRRNKTRTTIMVPNTIISRIKRVDPKTGVLQSTINVLLDKLANELDRNRLNEYDRESYAFGLVHSSLTLARRSPAINSPSGSVTSLTVQASSGDDGRRTSSVAPEAERPSQSPNLAVVPPGSAAGRKGRKEKA